MDIFEKNIVINYFADGNTPSEIKDKMRKLRATWISHLLAFEQKF